MAKMSAGILPYRLKEGRLEIFLVHPGGPFWAKKDLGAWSIAKGEFTEDEDPLDAARREFEEETGIRLDGDLIALEPILQKSGKRVHAWATEADFDAESIVSNTFQMEWPRGSGSFQEFSEVDRGAWFGIPTARTKINKAQAQLVDQLIKHLPVDIDLSDRPRSAGSQDRESGGARQTTLFE